MCNPLRLDCSALANLVLNEKNCLHYHQGYATISTIFSILLADLACQFPWLFLPLFSTSLLHIAFQ